MSLTKTGFRLTFTKPIDKQAATNVGSYSLRHFELDWHAGYGTNPSKAQSVIPKSVSVSDDGREVTLVLKELLTEKVYELHTNGLNATDGSKGELNPRLYGGLRTDANGRYRYETIRPAGYSIMPAHVHYVVTAPGYKPRIFDLWFEDDPLLAERRAAGQPVVPPTLQGDYLAIRPVTRDASGVWHVAAHDLQMLKE